MQQIIKKKFLLLLHYNYALILYTPLADPADVDKTTETLLLRGPESERITEAFRPSSTEKTGRENSTVVTIIVERSNCS